MKYNIYMILFEMCIFFKFFIFQIFYKSKFKKF